MSSIVIAGDTSGSVTLQAPAVAGSTILTLPATSGTVQTSGGGYTTNGVAFASSTSVLATGSALTFDGTKLAVSGAGIAGADDRIFTVTNTAANGYGAMTLVGTSRGGYLNFYNGATAQASIVGQASALSFYVGADSSGSEGMRLNSTGLGIGTSSPQSKLHVSDAVAGGQLLVTSNENNSSAKIGSLATMNYTNAEEPVLAISVEGGASENIVQIGGGPGEFNAATLIKFSTAANTTTTGGTERGRFASDGTFNVDCTAIPNGVNRRGFQVIPDTGLNDTTKVLVATTTTSTRALIEFNNGNGNVGSINTSGSATSYVTSSDYRLKNTIAPMTGALAKVALFKPVTYKWNVDGSDGEGFIAHELAEVCPDAVTGAKDAVKTYTDEDGNEQTRPVYQGIDTSFLVATLTAAIKEQQALITQLTERITALEAK